MKTNKNETLANRLGFILTLLNEGRFLNTKDLAQEFNVSVRTIERDLRTRLSFLPLEQVDGHYSLKSSALGNLDYSDLADFAKFLDVKNLLPNLTSKSLQNLFNDKQRSSLLIHSFAYENISHKNEYFEQLKVAIIENRNIDFTYTKGAEGKNYKKIQPYKLVNNKGIWYLAAVDHDKLKTFSFSKISHLSVDFDSSFTPSKAILGDIGLNRNIWFSSEQETVQLKVDSSVADYFKRRELINDQKIDSECENGDLLISLSISHPNQIIPIVRYWMPNIQIISPAYLNDEISESINEFKKRSINTSTP